ncbi:unnamed protein product [Caretta caretta]
MRHHKYWGQGLDFVDKGRGCFLWHHHLFCPQIQCRNPGLSTTLHSFCSRSWNQSYHKGDFPFTYFQAGSESSSEDQKTQLRTARCFFAVEQLKQREFAFP